LSSFKPRVGFVDDIKSAFAANNLAVGVTVFKSFYRGHYFHIFLNLGNCVWSVKVNRAVYKTKLMPESLDYDLAKKLFV